MTNKMFGSFGAVKNALEKAKDTAVGKATEALDANNDGTVDIQDIIILAIKLPGVHVTRESWYTLSRTQKIFTLPCNLFPRITTILAKEVGI